MLLMIGLLTFGIYYTSKKGKSLLNNIIVAFTMLLIGYSSFTMIVVRSNANPPLDENNPENAFFISLLLEIVINMGHGLFRMALIGILQQLVDVQKSL